MDFWVSVRSYVSVCKSYFVLKVIQFVCLKHQVLGLTFDFSAVASHDAIC